MARQSKYEGHLLSKVTNKDDQNILLKAAEFQCSGRLQEAHLEYGSLTMASRSIPGVSVYHVRLMLMKGDFQKASSCLEEIIDPKADVRSSPLNALLLILKCYCDIFIHLKLQEAVDMARHVREIWLENLKLDDLTDNFHLHCTLQVLLEYYYQGTIGIKSLLQERLIVDCESSQALRVRRHELYKHLKLHGRYYEALDVARMEMKFGDPKSDQLAILWDYLKLSEHLDTLMTTGDADYTFNDVFYGERRPLSTAHIHLSIGKVYCKLDREAEGLGSFAKAQKLFQGLQSLNGEARVDFETALLNKTKKVDYVGTCEELRKIANHLIKCEDWIATNSAMAELSEMLQCGPLSMQLRFQNCQLEIKHIYELTKDSFNFWRMQSQVWMLEFTKPSSYGKGIEMCTAFFNDNPECSIRLYKESFATMLKIAYEGIGDETEAIKWAELCIKLTEEVGDHSLVIANKVALAGLQRKLWKLQSQEKALQGIHYLEALFDEGSGGAKGMRVAEPHVLVILAAYLTDLWVAQSDGHEAHEAEKSNCLSNAMRWLQTGQNVLPDVQEDNKSWCRDSLIFIKAEVLQSMDRVEETVSLCDAMLSSHEDTLGLQEKGNIHYLLANALSTQSLRTQNIQCSLEMFTMPAQRLHALIRVSRIWRRSPAETPFTTPEILSWIKQWEEIWEEIRSEASVYRGLKGLQVKQRIREKNSTILYMTAIELCIEQKNIQKAWEWVQKAKARAVIDSLGLSRTVPLHLSKGLSDESTRLLQREQTLLDDIETTPKGGRYHLRMEHLELRRAMSHRTDLRPIQVIRQGGYLNLDELDSIFGGNKRVVCVDWVELESGEYHLITVRPGEAPRYFTTNVSSEVVRDWLNYYTVGEESVRNLEDALPEDLEALEGLVAPLGLADVTTENDLLVFIPTGLLCSIPLHALNFTPNGETRCIIERNPVVYINALAILRQVLVRSADTRVAETERVFRSAVFGDPTPDARAESKMVREVGEYLKADMFIGESATGDAFLHALTKYDLIHYQGHAEFHSADVLHNSVLKLHDHDINVHRLFETLVLQSPHISLVACQSGQQKLSIGDEPLGFLTALTIAGAGSILGTLWELDDIHASSVFTGCFYEGLCRDMRAGKESFVFELARAHQKAVCAMRQREETKGLYCWAPFILYGSPWLRFNSSSADSSMSR